MPRITRRQLMLSGLTALALPAPPGAAAARRYRLDGAASTVGFSFVLNGAPTSGTMPVSRADIRFDPADLSATTVDVQLDVTGARTPLIFATNALKSPDVLDAGRFPAIRFASAAVRLAQDGRLSGGAEIDGRLTLRGQTRPITLRADLFRARGTDPDDLSTLQVHLTGALSRSAFGASGYAKLVRDEVTLDIVAVIRAAP